VIVKVIVKDLNEPETRRCTTL